ncbi:GerAB/ArcD/ProY family transporter [Paenibacillus aceris]|nr:GerAB/ArcD/ProY family transporter [Paenibacillus aceris]
MKPIAITFSVLLPVLLILILFMSLFTLKFRQIDILLPLISEGAEPILKGTVTTFRAGMELFFLVLLSPHIQGKFKWKHLTIVLSIVSVVFVNGIVSLLTTFGPYEASKQRFPLFTQWRLVSISSFVEHLDFLSMYQWLSNTTILISMGLFLFGDLLTSKQLHKKIAIVTLTAILFICVELHINDSVFLTFTKIYYYPLSSLSILCWTVLAYLVTRKRGLS